MTTSFPKISVIQPGQRIFYTDSGQAIFGVPSSPEGMVAAAPGSLAIASNGDWFKKLTGHGNTGWAIQGGGGGQPKMLPPLTAPVSSGVGTSQPLQVYAIPAGSFPNDGDLIRYTMVGSVGPVDGIKFIEPIIQVGSIVEVGSPYPINSGFLSAGIPQDNVAFVGATGWRIVGEIVRITTSSLIFSASLHYGWLGVHSDNNLSSENQGAFQINGIFVGSTRNAINPNNGFSLVGSALSNNVGDLVQNLTTVEVINF
jgi:hypothetical protein